MGRRRARERTGRGGSENLGFGLDVRLFLFHSQHRRGGWMICFLI
jgi:hypothetical protein